MCVYVFSFVQLFTTPWTVACQVLLSLEFPRQEYWSGLPFLTPGDLPDPGIEPEFPALQADSLPLGHLGSPDAANSYTRGTNTTLGYCLRSTLFSG